VLGEEEGGGWCEGWGSLVVGGGGEGREWGGRGEPDASFGEVGVGEEVRSWLASTKSRPLASLSSKLSASPSGHLCLGQRRERGYRLILKVG